MSRPCALGKRDGHAILPFMSRQPAYETWPMAAHGRAAPGEPAPAPGLLLDARIRPNRSLPSPGFYALMIALVGLSFTAGIVFVSMGAWPVVGYFGLDVLLVWLLFRLSYRQGRRLEIVRVTPDRIEVNRRWANGWETRYEMPAAWSKVSVDQPKTPEAQARLTAMGKSLFIGTWLSPRERESLADAVRDALERAGRARGPQQGAQESGGAG